MSIVNTLSLESNRQIKINFDGGDLSSDAGLLLIKEFVSKLGIDKLFSHSFKTNDSASFRYHTDKENLLQMDCTEAYKEHIMYSFNGFCKVVIRYAAINAWRDRNRRRQREISFEYLTEEKFYPLSTSDEALKSPYEQYPVTICGQTIILTNGELAAALLSLPEKKREIIYLYFFGNYTQQEIGDLYGHCKSTAWHYIHSALQRLQEEMEVLLRGES